MFTYGSDGALYNHSMLDKATNMSLRWSLIHFLFIIATDISPRLGLENIKKIHRNKILKLEFKQAQNVYPN